MPFRVILLLIFSLLAGGDPASAAGEVRVTATLEPPSVTIDQPIRLLLRLEAEEPFAADLPEIEDVAGRWTVLGRERRAPPPGEAQGKVWELIYHLQPEDVGTLTLPLLEVLVRRAADGPLERLEIRPPSVEIVSVLQADPSEAKPRDIGQPVDLPERSTPWLPWLAGGTIVVAALLALAFRRRGRLVVTAPVVRDTPEALALAALDRLAAVDRSAPDWAPATIAQAIDIVRRFLEAARGVAATRSTSEELLAAMARDHSTVGSAREGLQSLLSLGDAAKFARAAPGAAAVDETLARARALVRELAAIS